MKRPMMQARTKLMMPFYSSPRAPTHHSQGVKVEPDTKPDIKPTSGQALKQEDLKPDLDFETVPIDGANKGCLWVYARGMCCA